MAGLVRQRSTEHSTDQPHADSVDTPSTVSSALYSAQAGLKELVQVTLKINSKLREIEK